eukprot:TRINITY_DN4061_c0_g1_i3.p1 TRINITY_DN4061_c0_g1~~TRINITY_DN4061_c0_g1_i3.p1  ORF type:complete len:393 (+),score=45.50 TRINITY_DN4061_c0_g1_i3:23-1180(+)
MATCETPVLGRVVRVTCECAPNIACIKYWGKRDSDLILPLNSSLSVTLGSSALRTTTTVELCASNVRDRFWLNGLEQDVAANARLMHCLAAIRKLSNAPHKEWKMYIMSVNNFPTRAGLASSASGFACLVACMAHALEVTADVSGIARLGSGSACRSMFGGFVEWRRGADPSGVDSIAHQLFNDTHWPELEILILVVNEGEKAVGSTPGMQASVKTSALLQQRVASIPQKIEALKLAIAARDFGTFAEITMKDSNQMHAVCLDTYPPLFYMNDTSRTIVDIVSQLNVAVGKLIVRGLRFQIDRPGETFMLRTILFIGHAALSATCQPVFANGQPENRPPTRLMPAPMRWFSACVNTSTSSCDSFCVASRPGLLTEKRSSCLTSIR